MGPLGRIVGSGVALGLAMAGWGLTRSVPAEAARCDGVAGVVQLCTVNDPGNRVVAVVVGPGLGLATVGAGIVCTDADHTGQASLVAFANSSIQVPLGNTLIGMDAFDPLLCRQP